MMIKLSARICDQCHTKHRRCDRQSPSCSRCLKNNLECTWDRPRVLPQNVNFSIKNYVVEKTEEENNSRRPRIRKKSATDNESTNDKTLKIKWNPPLLAIQAFMPSSRTYTLSDKLKDTLLLWNLSTVRRNTFKNFLYSCNISVEDPRKSDFKLINQVLGPGFLPLKRIDYLPFQLVFSDNDVTYLTHQAIQAYFYYFNPFFPLFSYSSFLQRPRSEFLKAVVISVGLRFLPRSGLRDQLVATLESQLMHHEKLSNLKFDLDTLQALIGIYAGLVWSSVEGMNYSLFLVAISIMYSIGLHRGSTETDPDTMIERSLAFYIISFLSTKFFLEGVPNFTLMGMNKSKFSKKVLFLTGQSRFPYPISAYQPLTCDQFQLFSILVTETMHQVSNTLKQARSIFLRDNKNINSILLAEKNILTILNNGISKFIKFFQLKFGAEALNCTVFQCCEGPHSTPLELIHVFRMRVYFDLIRLFDMLLRARSNEFKKTIPNNVYQRVLNYTSIVIRGLSSVNPKAPFIFYRLNMLLFSARVAIQSFLYTRADSIRELANMSCNTLMAQGTLEIYAYPALIQRELLESLIKKTLT